MKSIFKTDDPQKFSDFIALYAQISCSYCDGNGQRIADNGLRTLWDWWLSDSTRNLISAHTRVDVGGREDRQSLRIIFQCERKALKNYQPIFNFVSQHWPRKAPPHNQLQVPCSDIGKGLLKDKATDDAIRLLAAKCHGVAEKLHFKGKGSISLDSRISPANLLSLQFAISEMTADICRLTHK